MPTLKKEIFYAATISIHLCKIGLHFKIGSMRFTMGMGCSLAQNDLAVG